MVVFGKNSLKSPSKGASSFCNSETPMIPSGFIEVPNDGFGPLKFLSSETTLRNDSSIANSLAFVRLTRKDFSDLNGRLYSRTAKASTPLEIARIP